jgi:hypothetical protein
MMEGGEIGCDSILCCGILLAGRDQSGTALAERDVGFTEGMAAKVCRRHKEGTGIYGLG